MERGVPLLLAVLLLSACRSPGEKPSTAPEEAAGPTDQERREAYVRSNPSLIREAREAILEGRVVLGMIDEHILASWGPPWRRHRLETVNGPAELWIYGPPRRKALTLYLTPNDEGGPPIGVLLDWIERSP